MLYVKNNRIYTASFSFELPEDLIIITDPCNIKVDTLTFETVDGKFMVEIAAQDLVGTPADRVAKLKNNAEVIVTDIIPVERGGMKGYGIYYSGRDWRYEYYEEFLDYPMNAEGQTILNFCIQHEILDMAQRNQVKGMFEQANIQAFLNSIRYEPKVCDKVINCN